MAKYRARPVVIEAIHISESTIEEIANFLGPEKRNLDWRMIDGSPRTISIVTPEGTMYAQPTDYIVKGTAGEFYPVRESIFVAKYERESTGEYVPWNLDQVLEAVRVTHLS